MSKIHVNSEIGTLKRLLVHSPDGGIGKVIPAKAQDWLYEDIVDLKSMQAEYDIYKKTLLAFLDPPVLKKWFEKELEEDAKEEAKTLDIAFIDKERPSFVKPSHDEFLDSDKVVEVEKLLEKVLQQKTVREQIVSTVCGLERIDFVTVQRLLNLDKEWLVHHEPIKPGKLAKVLITGIVLFRLNAEGEKEGKETKERQLFPPIPNFIFTRDIGIVVNDHLLLSKLNKTVRQRESLLIKYIAYYDLFRENWDKIIELNDDNRFFLYDEVEMAQHIVTVEGGDVMMVHKDHLLIGCSERTTPNAVNKLVNQLFEKKIVKKVTAIVIPNQRETMHIDTAFTQIKRNSWVIFGPFSKKRKDEDKDSLVPSLLSTEERKKIEGNDIRIVQFLNEKVDEKYKEVQFEYIEDLFEHISREDFGCQNEMQFIYCGGQQYPNGVREQWTDACNLLAIKEGVVLGYDRNRVTSGIFKEEGFEVIQATRLLNKLKQIFKENPEMDLKKELDKLVLKDTLILLPSTELSRARGGSHCMSMPLLRDEPFLV